MQLACPKCGTREIRVSARHGLAELVKGLCGIYQLRCRRCQSRWETSMWSDGAWKYARCPRCYRQQLTTWSLQYYHPPASVYTKIKLGATPYRCAACRCNFASFRPCREKFTWRHQTHGEGAPALPKMPVPQSMPLNESDLPALAKAVGTTKSNAPAKVNSSDVIKRVSVKDTVEPML